MPHQQIEIETRDGRCPTHVFTPEGEGPWPAAIVYMDALAIRPALIAMAERLSNAGHVVLLPDLFYRYGPYPSFDPNAVFAGDFRAIIGPLRATTSNRKAAEDSAAFLACLDGREDVTGKVGVVGYCMGGGMALAAAGTYPDRIAAAGLFHAGNLATDDEDSPHRLVPTLKAELYVGVADNDHSYPPEMAERFKAALDDAHVTYRHEFYPGAAHGWTMPDFPVYDEAAAERHWRELLALFTRSPGRAP
jgi:carboxymethylenebutenolidase